MARFMSFLDWAEMTVPTAKSIARTQPSDEILTSLFVRIELFDLAYCRMTVLSFPAFGFGVAFAAGVVGVRETGGATLTVPVCGVGLVMTDSGVGGAGVAAVLPAGSWMPGVETLRSGDGVAAGVAITEGSGDGVVATVGDGTVAEAVIDLE